MELHVLEAPGEGNANERLRFHVGRGQPSSRDPHNKQMRFYLVDRSPSRRGTVYGCVLAEVLARAGADRIFVWGSPAGRSRRQWAAARWSAERSAVGTADGRL